MTIRGQEASFEDSPLGKGTVWGYNPGGLDYQGAIQVNGEGDRRAQASISEMEYLVSQRKWANPMIKDALYTEESNLEERVAFLKQNGVNLYGAVITAPTKELLHLKQEPLLQILTSVKWFSGIRINQVQVE